MIAKLRYFVPSTVLVNIYNSLILPYITYGLLAWGNASNAYLNRGGSRIFLRRGCTSKE